MDLPEIDPEASYERLKSALQAGLSPSSDLVIVSIADGGLALGRRIRADLFPQAPFGVLNSSFHRDDIGINPIPKSIQPTTISFDVTGKTVLLVDDVFATGRTLRAALNELFDHGRPASVRCAVLVDTRQRILPLAPDFSGVQITIPAEIRVLLQTDGPKSGFVIKFEQR